MVSGGCLVAAVLIPAGPLGQTPGLMFRFAKPDGTGFYPATRNIGDDGPYVFKACAHCHAMSRLTTVTEASDWYGEGYTAEDFGEWEPGTIWEARLRAQWRRRWRASQTCGACHKRAQRAAKKAGGPQMERRYWLTEKAYAALAQIEGTS